MISTWLDRHIEEWIKPKLGHVPNINQMDWHINQWKKADILALQAVWKEGKRLAGERQILLAGRDVWLFEVLAQIEGFPTIFRPDISSNTCSHIKEDYTECYLLDTGFSGSVPRAMKIKNFGLVKYSPPPPLGYCGWPSLVEHQVFPRANRQEILFGPWPDFRTKTDKGGFKIYLPAPVMYRGKNGLVLEIASKMEGTPKYWTQAVWLDSGAFKSRRIEQKVETSAVFMQAAQVTIHIVKNLKPSLISPRG